ANVRGQETSEYVRAGQRRGCPERIRVWIWVRIRVWIRLRGAEEAVVELYSKGRIVVVKRRFVLCPYGSRPSTIRKPTFMRFVSRPQGGSGSACHPSTIHHPPSVILFDASKLRPTQT